MAPSVQGEVPSIGPNPVSAEPLSSLFARGEETVVLLYTGATATSPQCHLGQIGGPSSEWHESVELLETFACLNWLDRHNCILERLGVPTAQPYPARAKFKFGNGHMEDARFAADNSAGLAGGHGALSAFSAGVDIPTLFRGGSLELLDGELDVPRNCQRLQTMGLDVALRASKVGRRVLGAASFDATGGPRLGCGPTFSASRLPEGSEVLRPDPEDGLSGRREWSV